MNPVPDMSQKAGVGGSRSSAVTVKNSAEWISNPSAMISSFMFLFCPDQLASPCESSVTGWLRQCKSFAPSTVLSSSLACRTRIQTATKSIEVLIKIMMLQPIISLNRLTTKFSNLAPYFLALAMICQIPGFMLIRIFYESQAHKTRHFSLHFCKERLAIL